MSLFQGFCYYQRNWYIKSLLIRIDFLSSFLLFYKAIEWVLIKLCWWSKSNWFNPTQIWCYSCIHSWQIKWVATFFGSKWQNTYNCWDSCVVDYKWSAAITAACWISLYTILVPIHTITKTFYILWTNVFQ